MECQHVSKVHMQFHQPTLSHFIGTLIICHKWRELIIPALLWKVVINVTFILKENVWTRYQVYLIFEIKAWNHECIHRVQSNACIRPSIPVHLSSNLYSYLKFEKWCTCWVHSFRTCASGQNMHTRCRVHPSKVNFEHYNNTLIIIKL